jgi:hypothetical protein
MVTTEGRRAEPSPRDASRIARETVLKVLRGNPGGGGPLYLTVRPGEVRE